MFFHAPRDIYGPELLRTFIDELGGVKRVHKYLGVTERTIWHWLSTGRAPRSAVLALFWESKWGRSQIFTDQVNEIRLLYQQVHILQDQYQRAKDIVAGLRAIHAGSANEPVFEELPDLSNRHIPTFDTADPRTATHDSTKAQAAPLTTAQNPCQGVKGFKETGRSRYVTDEEFDRVRANAHCTVVDAMDIALLTGQRPADVLKIKRTDIRDGALWIVQN